MTNNDISNKKKIMRKVFHIIVYGFALAGFGIIAAWAIFNLGLTKNQGNADANNRYLMEISEMGKDGSTETNVSYSKAHALDYYKIACISYFYPYNANLIVEALEKCDDYQVVKQMIASAELYINQDKKISKQYQTLISQGEQLLEQVSEQQNNNSAIEWMNSSQWIALRESIINEKAVIDSAAKTAGVEPRLIVATLIGEQIRLYNTNREVFKSYLGPVKVLVTETKFSLGVTGIKEVTAMRIEKYLQDSLSPFYISPKYENVLNFSTEDIATERIERLTNNTNNYYSYLYAGIMLHQFDRQWERAGFDISHNAGILTTLFNLGFDLSVPKAAPEIGGAKITIHGIPHTFGGLAFDFYYSGELIDEFPYKNEKFIN